MSKLVDFFKKILGQQGINKIALEAYNKGV